MNADILVIGAGASGLAAALGAKYAAPHCQVVIAEAMDRCGKKLLATGNGRCNIMNAQAAPESYFGDSAFTAEALGQYQNNYPAFWDAIGVLLAIEGEGRMYPQVNQASAVLDALRLSAEDRKIKTVTGFRVEQIKKPDNGFAAEGSEQSIRCKRVILATGGKAGKGLGENDSFVRLLQPFGHSFTPLYPALTCLKTYKGLFNGLKGVRLRGEVQLLQKDRLLGRETGEVLFQDDGVSGIAVMQLSLPAAPLIGKEKLFLRLSPLGKTAKEIVARRAKAAPEREAQQLLAGTVNRLILLNALKRAGIAPALRAGDLRSEQLSALSEALECWDIPIIAAGSFSEAQVMLGGAKTNEFFAETLESRLVHGLYAAGELLDVTGPCGGYNLEWAWASGLLAGRKAAESL